MKTIEKLFWTYLVVVYLAQKEFRGLVKNALETNSLEAEGFYINTMNASFVNFLIIIF